MRRCLIPSLALVLALPSAASAFCGFYVAGADASLVNEATLVVLLREGTTTHLSMRNDYRGPAEDFAMVVPVPVVLSEDDVKTLDDAVFARVDRLSAPRLVEYWEEDPCLERPEWLDGDNEESEGGRGKRHRGEEGAMGRQQVRIEAQFAVGEYEIVILSADDSSALDTWLRDNGYRIPEGADDLLRPYVEQGMKFFVAKVDVTKVRMGEGRAVLSPLRVSYESESLSLPVRLGLLSSGGMQDLVVNILSRDGRYAVANYDNVTIPTNLDVTDDVRTRFGEFYAALFDRVLERHPGAVVTEYAWQASSCDPCPGGLGGMSGSDIVTLGGEASGVGRFGRGRGGAYVLTRLHARYGRDDLGEDLVFRRAPPILGGRGTPSGMEPLDAGAVEDQVNNFQGRYIIRHPWQGPITCAEPERGIWGGPPDGAAPPPREATDTAHAPRGELELSAAVRVPLASLGIQPPESLADSLGHATPSQLASQGRGAGLWAVAGVAGLLTLVGVALFVLRRRG